MTLPEGGEAATGRHGVCEGLEDGPVVSTRVPCHFCRLVCALHTPPPMSCVYGTLHAILNSYLWNCVLSVCLSWRAVILSHSARRTRGCPANCC